MNKLKITTLISTCLEILPNQDRKKYFVVLAIQASLGIFDLVGVALLGVVGALSIRGIQSLPPGDRVTKLLEALHLENISFQGQVTALVSGALVFLVLKTILSVYWNRRILFFLSNKGAQISSQLFSKILAQNILAIRGNSNQEIQYSVGLGVSSITVGVLGIGSTLIADLSLLLIIGLGMALIDIYMAITSIVMFGLFGFILYFTLHAKARSIGLQVAQLNIKSNNLIQEALQMYREIFVKNRRYYYSRIMGDAKIKHSRAFAEQIFLPNISKYVIEIVMILGISLVAAMQFLLHDASRAAASMAVFIAAATRIAPAILRLQQSLVVMQGNYGAATPTLELFKKTQSSDPLKPVEDVFLTSYSGFSPSVTLRDVNFKFEKNSLFKLTIPELGINSGENIAIVGPSGSGKTTLVDLILGLYAPDAGEVLISGMNPLEVIAKWPGAIAYVPQSVSMSDASLLKNIELGYPDNLVNEDALLAALTKTNLQDIISNLADGLLSAVGENGSNLSGGQRQRVGIARALLSNPKLLILDEATSALDAQSEKIIGDAIRSLGGDVTVIHVAHRLSTVKEADKVVYMENGKIIATGSFDEVRKTVPNFDSQASLMGL